jgi:hypothetical protein
MACSVKFFQTNLCFKDDGDFSGAESLCDDSVFKEEPARRFVSDSKLRKRALLTYEKTLLRGYIHAYNINWTNNHVNLMADLNRPYVYEIFKGFFLFIFFFMNNQKYFFLRFENRSSTF